MVFRNNYKGHMDKTKGEGGEGGGRWVHLGWGGGLGRKGSPSTLLVGMQTGEATVENSMEFPQKTKNGTAL